MSDGGGSDRQPLLGDERSGEDSCCYCNCCCEQKLKISNIDMSEFGWFYADYAQATNARKFDTLMEMINDVELAQRGELELHEVTKLMQIFIWYYLRERIDNGDIELQNYPRLKDTEEVREELAKQVMMFYDDPNKISVDEIISWLTLDMPYLYVRRCTRLCPKVVCVIS